MITPTMFEDFLVRLRALKLGMYPHSSTIRFTFSAVWAETRLLFPLITLETVIMLTPALSAISFKVGFSMQFIPFLKIFQSKPIIKEYKKEIKEFINFYDLG